MNKYGLNKSVSKAAMASLLVLGMSAADVRADDDITQSRDLDAFTGIVIEGAMDITVKVGSNQTVEITTDEDYMDRVETRVESGDLIIGQKGRRWRNNSLEVEITVQSLDSFRVEGAADAYIEGISSDNFVVEIEGAADLTLEGQCVKAEYTINGAGDINSRDFICEDVNIEINGAGDADVYASKKIVATLNGIGDVSVYGDPNNIRPRINGLGSFEIK